MDKNDERFFFHVIYTKELMMMISAIDAADGLLLEAEVGNVYTGTWDCRVSRISRVFLVIAYQFY